MKIKTMKITGILLTLVMLVTMLGAFSLTASAAEGDTLTCTHPSDSRDYTVTENSHVSICTVCSQAMGEEEAHFGTSHICVCGIEAKASDSRGIYYATVAQAMANAQNPDEIRVLADDSSDFNIPPNVKLYGGSYTLSGTITNQGEIWSGVFKGAVRNVEKPSEDWIAVAIPGGHINEGVFYCEVISEHGKIKGGTFYGKVINGDYISKGIFHYEVINEDTIYGGTFNGKLTNASNGTIYDDSADEYFFSFGENFVFENNNTDPDGIHCYSHNLKSVANCQNGAICYFCGKVSEKNRNVHTGGNSTCKTVDVCRGCGSQYLNPDNHEYFEENNGFCCDSYQPATYNEENGYYEIGNAGQLYWFADKVNSGETAINGKLIDNIVVNTNVLDANGQLSTGNFRAWKPIGNSSNRYAGTLDGNKKTVSGLYFNEVQSYVGLFGYVDYDGKVQNLGVTNSYIYGYECVGGVVGWNDGVVENCYNTGAVGSNWEAGGVVGWNKGNVENCYNTGEVSSMFYAGGVVASNAGLVMNCYNTGNVGNGIGSINSSSGGVVGKNNVSGFMMNCYNTGKVVGESQVGGVVGYNDIRGVIKKCYNTGEVVGVSQVGGVVGLYEGESVINCYYLTGCARDENGTLQYGIGNETVGSTTEDVEGSTTGMSLEQFRSGEVAYILQDNQTENIWGQNLGTDNRDNHPVLGGAKVYYGYLICNDENMVYTNDSSVEGTNHRLTYSAVDNVLTAICGNCHTTATATITATGKTYDGTAVTASVEKTGILALDSYSDDIDNSVIYCLANGYELFGAPKNAGDYYVAIRINYENGVAVARIDYTIAKATLSESDFDFSLSDNLIYDGNDKKVSVAVKDGIVGIGDITVKYYDANENFVLLPINAGTYLIKIDMEENDNYKAISDLSLGVFTIRAKLLTDADVTVSEDVTYNGEAQIPTVTVAGLILDTDYTVSWDKEGFLDAGTYTVTVTGIDNYQGTVNKSYKIAPKALVEGDVIIDRVEATYDGSAHIPVITVKDGEKTLLEGTDYTISWNKNGFVDAGTYTATIKGKGNYSGEFTRTLVINQAEIKIELSPPFNYILPGNQVALTLDTNTDATPEWNIVGGSHVSGTKVKIAEDLTIGVDQVTITVTYPASNNYTGGFKTITLEVGMVDFSEEIADLEENIAKLSELIKAKADEDEIAQMLSDIEAMIAELENNGATDTELANAVSALEGEIAEEVTKLQNQISANDTDINGIKSSIATINGLINTLKKADEVLDGDISDAITKAENELKVAQDELKELIGDVQTNLDNAKTELDQAIEDLDTAMKQGDADLSSEIATLNTALTNAKEALEKADTDNKAELVKKIEEADTTLDAAIKAVQKNLDDAKTELDKAIKNGDDALDEKIATLNTALANAKVALEKADADNKAELTTKIDEAYASLDSALKAVQKNLDDLKAALEAKDNELANKDAELENKDSELENKASELQTFIIIVCVISGVALCGSGAFVAWFFIDRRKGI